MLEQERQRVEGDGALESNTLNTFCKSKLPNWRRIEQHNHSFKGSSRRNRCRWWWTFFSHPNIIIVIVIVVSLLYSSHSHVHKFALLTQCSTRRVGQAGYWLQIQLLWSQFVIITCREKSHFNNLTGLADDWFLVLLCLVHGTAKIFRALLLTAVEDIHVRCWLYLNFA